MYQNKVDQFWPGYHVCITGATGFVGSWFANTLVCRGENVSVLIRNRHKPSNLFASDNRRKVRIVVGRIENIEDVKD